MTKKAAPPKRNPATTSAKSRKASSHKSGKSAVPAKRLPKPAKTTAGHPKDSKQMQLIELLKSAGGATMNQMIKTTGWQPHSVRGVISGVLRKKLKLEITSSKAPDGGERVYHIEGSESPTTTDAS